MHLWVYFFLSVLGVKIIMHNSQKVKANWEISAKHLETEHVAKECLVIVFLQLNVAPSIRKYLISYQFKSWARACILLYFLIKNGIAQVGSC